MVRAEGLPLWAFDDPPAEERAAIFAEVRDQNADAVSTGASWATSSRASTRAPPSPGVLAACRAWSPDVVISETTEFAGPIAAEVVGVPSVCDRPLPAGQGGVRAARSSSPRSTSCAATSAWRPIPRGARMLRRPYFTLFPPRWRIPPRPPRAVRTASASRAPPFAATASTAGPPTGARSSTSPSARRCRACDFFPSLYRAAIDALARPAGAPARDRRARPRSGRRSGRCRPTCASSAGCRRPTSCRTWRRWSATAGRAR